ncbi:MAG: hypothetical protein IPP49_02025 [Saprospiraceae bacterium]|nr:hypothetical protein [Saprospiraceae bacterium]
MLNYFSSSGNTDVFRGQAYLLIRLTCLDKRRDNLAGRLSVLSTMKSLLGCVPINSLLYETNCIDDWEVNLKK